MPRNYLFTYISVESDGSLLNAYHFGLYYLNLTQIFAFVEKNFINFLTGKRWLIFARNSFECVIKIEGLWVLSHDVFLRSRSVWFVRTSMWANNAHFQQPRRTSLCPLFHTRFHVFATRIYLVLQRQQHRLPRILRMGSSNRPLYKTYKSSWRNSFWHKIERTRSTLPASITFSSW